MSPSNGFKPLIYRSTKADARNADVFIHWPRTGKIVACFNSQVTPVTSQTLLRWFDMVVAWDIGLKPVLKKVEMEQRGLLEYYPRPLFEDALADSHILEPGSYACFAGAHSMDPPSDAAVHFQGQETSIMTLWERARRNKYNAVVRGRQQAYDEIIAIPSEVLDQVSLPRDKCVFTGTTSDPSAGQDVVLSWFFPPYLRGEITTYAATREISLGDISWRSHFNLVPMRADVHQLWLQNAFSIDVADGHRICIFSKDALDIGLPERLGNPNSEWDVYLTEHFRYTLVVQVIGGDISAFGENIWNSVCDFQEKHMPHGGAHINLGDPIWETDIGRHVLQWITLQKLQERSHGVHGGWQEGDDEEDAENDTY